MNRVHGGNIYEVMKRSGRKEEEILDFSASVNPRGLSKKAEKKLKESFAAVLHYPDPDCSALTAALAGFYGLAQEQILAGAGSMEFIYSLPRVLQVKRPLLVTPAFSEYENALECTHPEWGCSIHYFETREEDGFELHVEGLLSALSRGYDALYLCNPNNPTGIVTEREDLLRILEQTERAKTWFILDEAFIDFAEADSLKDLAAHASGLVVLRSLTKFFALPGLRVGCLISNPGVVERFREQQEPWRVNTLGQVAAVESLQDEAYIRRSRETVREERDRLIHGLRSIPGFIPYPGAANYLLVQLHPRLNLTAAELREKLIPRGILIRDCASFHHLGPYFFRVAVRTQRENAVLIKALRQACEEKK